MLLFSHSGFGKSRSRVSWRVFASCQSNLGHTLTQSLVCMTSIDGYLWLWEFSLEFSAWSQRHERCHFLLLALHEHDLVRAMAIHFLAIFWETVFSNRVAGLDLSQLVYDVVYVKDSDGKIAHRIKTAEGVYQQRLSCSLLSALLINTQTSRTPFSRCRTMVEQRECVDRLLLIGKFILSVMLDFSFVHTCFTEYLNVACSGAKAKAIPKPKHTDSSLSGE